MTKAVKRHSRPPAAANETALDESAEAPDSSPPEPDLGPVVGANLRKLRLRRGLSLQRLARASGVSRAMLGQVELGHSTPTINLLWKVARALDVPFSVLITSSAPSTTAVLPGRGAKRLTSADGTFSSRALFPFTGPRAIEFYELRLLPRSIERADAHSPGTTENIVVASGSLEIRLGRERHRLGTGDAIFFEADVPHEYVNPAEAEAVLYLVMSYRDRSN